MSYLDRFLGHLDDAEATGTAAKIRAFEIVLVIVAVTDLWEHGLKVRQLGGTFPWPLAVVGTLSGAAALVPASRRLGFLLLSLSIGVLVRTAFPATGNHVYLESFLCAICALLDSSRSEERVLLTRAVRWVTCVIFFYAGLQKLTHGYYTNALMPAYLLKEPRFEWIFGALVPASEVERIRSYTAIAGAGPYLVSSLALLVVSNLAWVLEIALALALFVASTRRAAVFAGIAFVVFIELGAREITFGLQFVNALLMFMAGDSNRRFIPVAALICIVLVLMRLGWLPAVEIY
jgi:hypothetical protein